jgi:glycosyltransferase involved in cell wall biosynthesis
MKISMGIRLRAEPWGGGNQVGQALVRFLKNQQVEVCFNLRDRDIDLILLTEPNPKSESAAFNHWHIFRYLLFKNRKALVVHRINNSSEARDDPEKRFNRFRIRANRLVADHTVFISNWLRERYRESGFSSPYNNVIYNGGDRNIWHCRKAMSPGTRLRIVTHHWSTNPNKGFDMYEKLDRMLADKKWSDRIMFTYIGRLPEGLELQHSRYIPSLSGNRLADEIRKNDIYLTASRNEAAGMHHIEGALCGLPLLYIESGGIPEYCRNFGIGYTPETFENALAEMIRRYAELFQRMPDYPHTAETMSRHYLTLFEELLVQRDDVLRRRRPAQQLYGYLRNGRH